MKHASKRSGAALNYIDPKQPKRSATPSSDITDVKNKGRIFTFTVYRLTKEDKEISP